MTNFLNSGVRLALMYNSLSKGYIVVAQNTKTDSNRKVINHHLVLADYTPINNNVLNTGINFNLCILTNYNQARENVEEKIHPILYKTKGEAESAIQGYISKSCSKYVVEDHISAISVEEYLSDATMSKISGNKNTYQFSNVLSEMINGRK